MPQLEHHALARRQTTQGLLHLLPQFSAQQPPLRIAIDTLFAYRIQTVASAFWSRNQGGILPAHFAFPELVQAQIRHNAVQPSVKTTIEPEIAEVAKHPQERFLINVVRV